MDIEKHLVPKIRARFGDRPIEEASETGYVAIFRAKHPEVGDICVSDERDEITIFVGKIAYQNFYDRGFPEAEFQYSSEDDYAERISEEAVEWLGESSPMMSGSFAGAWSAVADMEHPNNEG